jgi:hypothetical protein
MRIVKSIKILSIRAWGGEKSKIGLQIVGDFGEEL